MRLFLAMTALAGLLVTGIGCAAAPESGPDGTSDSAAEPVKGEGATPLSDVTKSAHPAPTSIPRHCVEDVICVDGKHWDTATCSCVGPVCDPIVCQDGQHWDEATCACEGPVCDPIVCHDGQHWDPQTCACEGPVCDPIHCGANEVWNEQSCSCICIERAICVDGKVWDPSSCSCVCGVEPDICLQGEHWSAEACRCVGPSTGN
jgi:hypothetical protein